MADKVYLFTGTAYSTVSLELALASDDIVLLTPGSEMGTPEHDNIWHTSQWADGDRLVRHRVKNRQWPMHILAGDKDSAAQADDLADSLIALERLIVQARRSHISGDVDKVGLYFKLEGASHPTYFTVIDMECNGMSLMEEISRIRRDAQATFILTTEPYGYGDEETIENWLLTPHFQEDGDADGLADNWNEDGSPTTTLDTDTFLCGSQSQKVAGTSEGVYSDAVACTAYQESSFVAYAWVLWESGNDVKVSIDGDDSGELDVAMHDDATVTATDADGNVWRQVSLSGTVGAADTTLTLFTVIDQNPTPAASVYYVDKCYLQLGVSTIPTAWCSQNLLYQHSDSTEGVVNYLDVTDVPGDVESETEYAFSNMSASLGYSYLGRRSSSQLSAATGYSKKFAVTGETHYAVDAARINGGKWTATPTSSFANITDYFDITLPAVNAISPKYRVVASINDTNGDQGGEDDRADFRLIYLSSGENLYTESTKFPPHDTTARWAWVDLGVIDLSRHDLRRARSSQMSSSSPVSRFSLQSKRNTGSFAISCDCIMFLPVEDDAFCMFRPSSLFATGVWYLGNLDTEEEYLHWTGSWYGNYVGRVGGAIPNLLPGEMHRLYCMMATTIQVDLAYYYDLSVPTNYVSVGVTYRPRVKYLRGR